MAPVLLSQDRPDVPTPLPSDFLSYPVIRSSSRLPHQIGPVLGPERTISHATRQLVPVRCAAREPGSSSCQRNCAPLTKQSIRRVEATYQAKRAAGPTTCLLRGQDHPHPRPAGGEPNPTADSRQPLAPTLERRLSGLRLCPDRPSRPRLWAPAILLPRLLEE